MEQLRAFALSLSFITFAGRQTKFAMGFSYVPNLNQSLYEAQNTPRHFSRIPDLPLWQILLMIGGSVMLLGCCVAVAGGHVCRRSRRRKDGDAPVLPMTGQNGSCKTVA